MRHPTVLAALGASDAHVGNVGKSGVDSRALKLILEKVLPQYYPPLDLVITMVGASDILRWLEIGAPAGECARPLSASECFCRHPDVDFSWDPRRTALSHLARNLRQQRRSSAGTASWFRRARQMRANASTIIRNVPDATAVCAAYAAHLEGIVSVVRAHARHLIVARQPWFAKEVYSPQEEAAFWQGGIGKAYRQDKVSTYYSAQVLSELMQKIDDITVGVANRASIPHVDLRPALEMSLESFYDQFHMRATASEPIARCLMPVILEVCRPTAQDPLSAGTRDEAQEIPRPG
ncbi:MAG: hypothetical protein HXY20_06195 [Acidobacteria bacterium]|nr:hypothetical protein [Acidobacteriota bacterium]